MSAQEAHAPVARARGLEAALDTSPAEEFRAAFRDYPAGVAIITADDGSGPAGLTATSVVSVSPEPALVAFSLSAQSSATPVLAGAASVVVHLLGADQVALAERFATRGAARFANPTSWTRLTSGEPLLHGVNSWLRCRILEQHEAGTGCVVIARVLQAQAGHERSVSLVYRNRTWYSLDDATAL